MSKKRPGWQAVNNLIAIQDVQTWDAVEQRAKDIVKEIPKLPGYERDVQAMSSSTRDVFSKAEMNKAVSWKHTVGKARAFNLKLLNANNDASVKQHSKAAIALAREINLDDCLDKEGSPTEEGSKSIKAALVELTKLSGVGPATASAMLTLVRPDIFCYMYDEAVDCFEKKRDYRIDQYIRVNGECLERSQKLGYGWTTSRVSRTIWTAARLLHLKGEDLTRKASQSNGNKSVKAGNEGTGTTAELSLPKRTRKRRKLN